MIDDVAAGRQVFHDIYSEADKRDEPSKENTGLLEPLGVGFLTGAIGARTRFAPGDIRAIEGRFAPKNLSHNLALVELLKTWADRKQARLGQIALA